MRMDIHHQRQSSKVVEPVPTVSSNTDEALTAHSISPCKPRFVRTELDMIGEGLAQVARAKGTLPLEHESLRRLWNEDLPETPGQYVTAFDSATSSTKATPARSAIGPLILATPEEATRSSYFAAPSTTRFSPDVRHLRGGTESGSSSRRYGQSTNPSSPTSMRHSMQSSTSNAALLHPHLQQQQFVTRDRSRSMPPLFLSHASDPALALLQQPSTPALRAAISDPFVNVATGRNSHLRPMAEDFTPSGGYARLTPPPIEFLPVQSLYPAPMNSTEQDREDFLQDRGLNEFTTLPDRARFFVIKSFDREDVLKAM